MEIPQLVYSYTKQEACCPPLFSKTVAPPPLLLQHTHGGSMLSFRNMLKTLNTLINMKEILVASPVARGVTQGVIAGYSTHVGMEYYYTTTYRQYMYIIAIQCIQLQSCNFFVILECMPRLVICGPNISNMVQYKPLHHSNPLRTPSLRICH